MQVPSSFVHRDKAEQAGRLSRNKVSGLQDGSVQLRVNRVGTQPSSQRSHCTTVHLTAYYVALKIRRGTILSADDTFHAAAAAAFTRAFSFLFFWQTSCTVALPTNLFEGNCHRLRSVS